MFSRNSRFAPNREPMTPMSRNYGHSSQCSSNIKGRKDKYEEAYDYCHEVLKEIQDRYDRASKVQGPKSRNILAMKNNLITMENQAKKINLDLEKEIQDSEDNAEIKKKIVNEIRMAQNLIMLIEATK